LEHSQPSSKTAKRMVLKQRAPAEAGCTNRLSSAKVNG
jgi:hypothetical protein